MRWPATVSDPFRADPLLAPIVKLTVPAPDPETPDVTLIQLSLLAAVHAHPDCAETATEPGPPDPPIDSEPGETVYEHPLCATCTV
jgi:hypothetical protein